MPAALIGQRNTPAKQETNTDETTHLTAFMILIDKDGNTIFEPDINKPVIPERKPEPREVKHAVSDVLDDIKAQEQAATMISMQMQMARQMQEQAVSQQMMQQLQKGR